jgi:hypothetical protein
MESVVRPRAWCGHLLVTLLWAGVLAVSTRVELGHAALTVAVAVHVMALVIGLGAVLLVDWYGLVWMAGLRPLRASAAGTGDASAHLARLGPTAGIAHRVGPGPGKHGRLDQAGSGVVLLNNGVALRAQSRRLRTVSTAAGLRALPRALRAQLVSSVAVWQVSWWGAVVFGFITDGTRSGT